MRVSKRQFENAGMPEKEKVKIILQKQASLIEKRNKSPKLFCNRRRACNPKQGCVRMLSCALPGRDLHNQDPEEDSLLLLQPGKELKYSKRDKKIIKIMKNYKSKTN